MVEAENSCPSSKDRSEWKKFWVLIGMRLTDLRGAVRSSKPYNGVAAAENMKHWIQIDDWKLK